MHAAITGLGMITSVGNDAASSCAAVRAGIARPGALPIVALDREGLSAEPVAGHPVRPLTSGFEGVAVHALLARHALRDLARSGSLAALREEDWERTRTFVCVSPARAEEPERWDAELSQVLPLVVATVAGLPVRADRIVVVCGGHAGVLLAAARAIAALDAGEIDRAIVLGVDSLVGQDEVEWLASEGRLKTADQQVGLMPGQGAAALLLEPARARRGANAALALLADVSAAPVVPLREDDLESNGKAIAQAIVAARAGASGPIDVYGDPNGETWRAREWGTALVHLRRAGAADDLVLALPANALGDTGAASGAIAIGLAVRALARGYARGPRALVWSRSEHEHVAAARVEAAPGRA